MKSPSSPSSFWQVWLQHKDHLHQQSLRLMGGSEPDADDALNTAMLRALQRFSSSSGEIHNEKAWLSRILYNVCMDLHRERRRRVDPEELLEEAEISWGAPLEDSPDEVLLQRERAEEIHGCIEALPLNLRKPFTMRFLQDMSYADIALHLQLTNCNVRKRIQLAYGILRVTLAEVLLAR
ncbi:MAG: RNA polymerase sigma factor [Hyalangium sp.]|uniref:RNA polymerase sigma factor n=1 Tax=Hyalangium sp. TaxID=2028555 RepID=UPI003899FDFD